MEPDFKDFYKDEWVPHIRDSGGIQAQLKLLTRLVMALLAGYGVLTLALISFLVQQAT